MWTLVEHSGALAHRIVRVVLVGGLIVAARIFIGGRASPTDERTDDIDPERSPGPPALGD